MKNSTPYLISSLSWLSNKEKNIEVPKYVKQQLSDQVGRELIKQAVESRKEIKQTKEKLMTMWSLNVFISFRRSNSICTIIKVRK